MTVINTRIYITADYIAIDNQFRILKKKISYEGIIDIKRRKKRFLSRRKNKELKRIKKHAFRAHLRGHGNN